MKNVFIYCFLLMHRQIRFFQKCINFFEFLCSCISVRDHSCFFQFSIRNLLQISFVISLSSNLWNYRFFFVRNHRHFFDFSHIHFRHKTFFFFHVCCMIRKIIFIVAECNLISRWAWNKMIEVIEWSEMIKVIELIEQKALNMTIVENW